MTEAVVINPFEVVKVKLQAERSKVSEVCCVVVLFCQYLINQVCTLSTVNSGKFVSPFAIAVLPF